MTDDWESYRVGYGLLRRGDQILAVGQHWRWGAVSDLVWTLPGGRAEPGEPIEAAVRREFEEETGLSVSLGRLLYVTEVIFRDRRQHFLSLIFAVEETGGALGSTTDEYVIEASFLAPDELEQRLTYETFRLPLQRYLAAPNGPAFYTSFEL